MIKVSHSIGSPPGTLHYTGQYSGERTKITLIKFNEKDYFEEDFFDLSECMLKVDQNMINWINVDGIHHLPMIEKIGKHFNIHPLTLEDIVNVEQRPKFEDYDHYLIVQLKMITYKEVMNIEHLSLVLLKNTVISFQEPDGGDAFDMIRERLRQAKGRIRKNGADYMFYALLDSVVDWYFQVIEIIGEKLEVLESEILRESGKITLLNLYKMKREVIRLRKHVWPLRDLMTNLMRSESQHITNYTDLFYRDLMDHVSKIMDTIEQHRDLLNGLMDLYLSFNSNKMNEVMKVLTIMSSIFIPVTFVAGVYGMNFDYMPELRSPFGYIGVWIVMLTMMGGLIVYFRRKKWM